MGGVEAAVCRRVKVSIEGPWVHRVLKLEGNLVADIGRNLAGGMAGVHIGDCMAAEGPIAGRGRSNSTGEAALGEGGGDSTYIRLES